MNNTQKILIAIVVGVGAAIVYNRYMKNKSKKTATSPKTVTGTFEMPQESVISDMSREEKEEFILDNVFATPQEVSSGFEGTRFVWNPTIGKMYPVGTIEVGQTPSYIDSVFFSAEGDMVSDIPESVINAESLLKALNDQEIELLFIVVKKQTENPTIISEENVLTEMGVNNQNIIKVFKSKLKKVLNDIKALKSDVNWSKKWEARKLQRKKRRNDFKERMGFDKSIFDAEVSRVCGRNPKTGNKAQYKKCVETVANKLRGQIVSQVREEVSNAPVGVKDNINSVRQQSFAKQVTKRRTGAMFAGRRWDGENNNYVENLVDKGIVK